MSKTVARVLVVDDLEDQLESVREHLEVFDIVDLSFSVIKARNLSEALSFLEQADVVVLDYRLTAKLVPGRTGLEVLREIRKRDQFIPVILFSGFADEIDKLEVIREGVTFILVKGGAADELPLLLARITKDRNEIVAELERWAKANPSASEPTFMTAKGLLTMNDALEELRQRTPLGRALLHQYRQGITEIFVAQAKRALGKF